MISPIRGTVRPASTATVAPIGSVGTIEGDGTRSSLMFGPDGSAVGLAAGEVPDEEAADEEAAAGVVTVTVLVDVAAHPDSASTAAAHVRRAPARAVFALVAIAERLDEVANQLGQTERQLTNLETIASGVYSLSIPNR